MGHYCVEFAGSLGALVSCRIKRYVMLMLPMYAQGKLEFCAFRRGWLITPQFYMQHTRLNPIFLHNFINPSWHIFNIDSRCWKHSWEILVHIDMMTPRSYCRFVSCRSKCSPVGLWSGDCGGPLSTLNSLSCSRNRFKMIWALWHAALFPQKQPSVGTLLP